MGCVANLRSKDWTKLCKTQIKTHGNIPAKQICGECVCRSVVFARRLRALDRHYFSNIIFPYCLGTNMAKLCWRNFKEIAGERVGKLFVAQGRQHVYMISCVSFTFPLQENQRNFTTNFQNQFHKIFTPLQSLHSWARFLMSILGKQRGVLLQDW